MSNLEPTSDVPLESMSDSALLEEFAARLRADLRRRGLPSTAAALVEAARIRFVASGYDDADEIAMALAHHLATS